MDLFFEVSLPVVDVGEKEQALALFNVGGRSGGAPSPAESSPSSLPLSLLLSSLGWRGSLAARLEETHSWARFPLVPWSKVWSLLLRTTGCYYKIVRSSTWKFAEDRKRLSRKYNGTRQRVDALRPCSRPFRGGPWSVRVHDHNCDSIQNQSRFLTNNDIIRQTNVGRHKLGCTWYLFLGLCIP